MIRLNQLLNEVTQRVMAEYSDEEKQRMGIPADAESRGGYWFNSDGSPAGKVVSGKFVAATDAEKQAPTTAPTAGSSAPKASTTQGSFKRQKGTEMYMVVHDSLTSAGLTGPLLDRSKIYSKGFVPLSIAEKSRTKWTRFDGPKYQDWTSITPDPIFRKKTEEVLEKDPEVLQRTFQHYIDSTGAKKIGQIRGEFGSSGYNDVYKTGDTLFIHRGDRIDVGSASRLRNSKVWDFKKNNAEK
jgi:hypothetical protein